MVYGRLDVFWPEGKIESYSLDTPTVSVGRAPGNTIALETDAISRYHFSITHQDGKVHLTDLDSANGTFIDGVRLQSNAPFLLDHVEEIQIGQLRMLFHPGDDAPTMPMTPADDATQPIAHGFRLNLEDPELDVWPASHSSTELAITNSTENERRFLIKLVGLPEGWGRINHPKILIDPQQTSYILINIKPVRHPDTTPGEYPVKIEVQPEDKPDFTHEMPLPVRIHGYSGFGMALSPRKLESPEALRIFLHNHGSVALPITVNGVDRQNILEFDLPTAPIVLNPGQRMQVTGHIKPKQSVLVGSPREIPFDIVIRSEDAVAFTAAEEGKVVINPRIPNWMAISGGGILLSIILIFLLGGLLSRPTEPTISLFNVNSTQVAQGDPLFLEWAATDVTGYSVQINGIPLDITLEASSAGIQLETDQLAGMVEIVLEGSNGGQEDRAVQQVEVYTRRVEPQPMVRYVTDEVTIHWRIDSASVVRLSIPEAFSSAPVASDYPAEGNATFAGIPEGDFTVMIVAEDDAGNIMLEVPITVETINPECTPASGDVVLREGPDALHKESGSVPSDLVVPILGRYSQNGWLLVELPSGVQGWASADTFTCADTFQLDNLKIESNVSPVPTLTLTPTLIPTATHTPPPTFTPTPPPPPTQEPPPPTSDADENDE